MIYSVTKRLLFLIVCLSLAISLSAAPKYAEATIDGKSFFFKAITEGTADDYSVTTIQVLNKKDSSVYQSITGLESQPSYELAEVQSAIELRDVNFDGYIDISIMEFLPAGPNLPYLFWTYNPKTKKFDKFTGLEGVTSPEFDYKQKLIISFWRESAAHHGKSTFKYINGVVTEIVREEIEHDFDSDENWYTKSELKNGKMAQTAHEKRKVYELD